MCAVCVGIYLRIYRSLLTTLVIPSPNTLYGMHIWNMKKSLIFFNGSFLCEQACRVCVCGVCGVAPSIHIRVE